MSFKALKIYFIGLTLIFLFLLGFMDRNRSDIELQNYTAMLVLAPDGTNGPGKTFDLL